MRTAISSPRINPMRIQTGLPANAYLSKDFWEQEQQRLFPRSWTLAGYTHQLPNPGDARPFTIAGQPILLLRDNENQLRAFHNVCSHRCMKLVDTAKNLGKSIRCPYHAWLYALDGSLRATPHFGGPHNNTPDGFDPKEHGLKEIRMGIWQDWIFVNLDGNAMPFEDFTAPMRALLGDLDLSRCRHLATLELGEVKTNWKFLMENFIEPYHVQFVHVDTTDQPLVDHYTMMREHCFGSGVDVSSSGKSKQGSLAVSSLYLTLFPSFILGHYAPDQLGVYLHEPIAPGRTRQWRAIYALSERDYSDEDIEQIKSLWTKVHQEDHAICEGMQEGRRSQQAQSGGMLSPHWESAVRGFQDMVLQAIDPSTTHPLQPKLQGAAE